LAIGNHTHTGVYEPADGTILKDADIGVTVQAYDATYLVDADIGVTVNTFIKNNFVATAPPSAATDDTTLGYVVGSVWIDVTNDKAYTALDVTDGAAVWVETSSGTADVTYETLNTNGDVGTSAGQLAIGNHTHTGVYEPADGTILKDADIGVTVQAYDATYLVDADIGVNVQAYSASNALTSDITYEQLNTNGDVGTTAGTLAIGNHTHTGVYEPADGTILKDADIGVTVQAYDATYVVDADIGVTVQAYDSTILKQADVDDVPVNGVTAFPISSNWAFDHDVASTHFTEASISIPKSQISDFTEADYVHVTGIETVGGAKTFSAITTVSSLLNADGGIAVDSTAFTVANTSGNVLTAGTLTVGGLTDLNGSTQIGDTTWDGTSTIDMGGNVITNAGAGVDNTDVVIKSQLDAAQAGILVKASCRVATAAALPAVTASGGPGVGKILTADAVGILTVDGVATVLNDRVLVKDQVTGADNGIYKVTTEGTGGVAFILTRATDYDGSPSAEVAAGTFTFINEGSTLDKSGWTLLDSGLTGGGSPTEAVVDTDTLTFTQFQGLPSYIGGTNINISGDTISVSPQGAASGLDADLLDAQHGAYYLDATNFTSQPSPVITLGGDLTGNVTLTNLGNGTLTATIVDDSHNHIISNVDGLQTALDGKQPIDTDLTNIAALTGTSGFLKTDGATVWSVDTSTYEPADGTILKDADIGVNVQAYDLDLTNIAALTGTSGFLKTNGSNTWSVDTTAYTTNVGTVTSVGTTGTVSGITLTGTVTTSGNLTLGGAIAGLDTAVITTGTFDNARIAASNVTQHVASIDHDSLLNFTSTEHFTQSAITTTGALNAGSITSGFGSIDNGASAITTTGTISAGDLDVTGDIILVNALKGSATVTTTSTTQTVLHTFVHATYGGGEYVIQATETGDRHITKILVTHDGTTAISTEFGEVITDTSLYTVQVDISGSDVRVLITSASATSTVQVDYRLTLMPATQSLILAQPGKV